MGPKSRHDTEEWIQNNTLLKQAEARAYNLSQQTGPHGTKAYNMYIYLCGKQLATSEYWWISTGPGVAWVGTGVRPAPARGPISRPAQSIYDPTISHLSISQREGCGEGGFQNSNFIDRALTPPFFWHQSTPNVPIRRYLKKKQPSKLKF